ncbi:MAG: shikimate dehydrogenase [Faecousia sp.]
MSKNYRAELVGVFGDPVEDNPTGVMEEAAFAACGLNYRYLTMKVTEEDLDAAMKSIRALHMKGMNLTMPHKVRAIPYLDQLSQAAQIIGAVNTIVVRDGKLLGENTDGKGFVQALGNAGVTPEGKHVVILGAGGAAKAIAVECALAGASTVTVFNRTREKADQLAAVINEHTSAKAFGEAWQTGQKIPEGTDILINATSIGFAPHEDRKPDIDYGTVTEDMVASDVVFCPAQTRFLEACAARGAGTVNGLGMLACQGALNFTLWTGVEAPLELMEQTLRRELGL